MTNPMMEALQILQKLEERGSTPQKLAFRCRIILTYRKRKHVTLVAQDLHCHYQTVYKWVRRWEKEIPRFLEHWHHSDFNPEKAILALLQDAPRSGAPPTFTPLQITQIIALGCRSPGDFHRPITHWTMSELADEVVKQGIAETVSETTLRRFFKSGEIKTPQKPLLAESQDR